jgi:hypothetical protein
MAAVNISNRINTRSNGFVADFGIGNFTDNYTTRAAVAFLANQLRAVKMFLFSDKIEKR